jgi:hypothetical protein
MACSTLVSVDAGKLMTMSNSIFFFLAIIVVALCSASPIPLSAFVVDSVGDHTTMTAEISNTVFTTASDVEADTTSSPLASTKWLRPCSSVDAANHGLMMKDTAIKEGCQKAFEEAIESANHVARDLHKEAKCIKDMFENVSCMCLPCFICQVNGKSVFGRIIRPY